MEIKTEDIDGMVAALDANIPFNVDDEAWKNADKKKRSGGAVRKSDTGSSMEIRVRELSSLGVPVF